MIKWNLETRKIKDLKEHPRNPRQMKGDQARQLQRSLEIFGIAEKPIINQDNQIIGGHQRLKTLKKMGITEIECWVPDRLLDEKEVDEFCLRLNKNTGEWDWDVLGNEWDLPLLIDVGFSPEEMHLGDIDDLASEEKEEGTKLEEKCLTCGQKIKG